MALLPVSLKYMTDVNLDFCTVPEDGQQQYLLYLITMAAKERLSDHDSSAFCIKSIKSNKAPLEVTIKEGFDFAEALESVYPLLEIIFGFLNYNDLKSAGAVKTSWSETAEKILEKRIQPSWFSCYKIKSSNIVSHSSNLGYNNASIGIILYDSRRLKLNKYICIHTNTTELSRKTVPEYLSEEIVPEKVDYCLISCPKVLSYLDCKVAGKEPRVCSIFDAIFIPKIPKVRTVMFRCNPTKKSEMGTAIRQYVKSDEEVKCLLMFCTKDLHKAIYNLLDVLLPENNPQSVAIGGGLIRGTKTFEQIPAAKRLISAKDTFCIAFLQEKFTKSEFNAFSWVIVGDDLSREEFEENLVEFKDNILLRTQSVGFRICCSAKVDHDEELIWFNKVFPAVPLIGLSADGEIGWNSTLNSQFVDKNGETQPKRIKKKYPDVQHQWSSVFVILTWGTF